MRLGFNIGSGQRPFTSTEDVTWINIDSQEKWNPDVVCSGSNLVDKAGFRIQDNTVDYVVLHHVLEHFGCGEGAGLVVEAHRVLKPGGSLFVFVPNLRALAKRWLEGGLSTQIYTTNLYGAFMGNEDDRHRWGFDPLSLLDFLNAATNNKWSEVKRFDWRSISGSDFARDFWIADEECVK